MKSEDVIRRTENAIARMTSNGGEKTTQKTEDWATQTPLIHEGWYPTQFPYQILFVSYNSNTMGATSKARTGSLPELPV